MQLIEGTSHNLWHMQEEAQPDSALGRVSRGEQEAD